MCVQARFCVTRRFIQPWERVQYCAVRKLADPAFASQPTDYQSKLLRHQQLERKAILLMQGDSRHIIVLHIDQLRALAVMDVPVDDRDPPQAMHGLGGFPC